MRFKLAFVLSFVVVLNVNAQQGQMSNAGAKSIGMGRVSSTLTGAEAIFGNPAAMDFSQNLIIHLSAEQRFLISGLSSASAGISKSINGQSAFSLSVSNFGIKNIKSFQFVEIMQENCSRILGWE